MKLSILVLCFLGTWCTFVQETHGQSKFASTLMGLLGFGGQPNQAGAAPTNQKAPIPFNNFRLKPKAQQRSTTLAPNIPAYRPQAFRPQVQSLFQERNVVEEEEVEDAGSGEVDDTPQNVASLSVNAAENEEIKNEDLTVVRKPAAKGYQCGDQMIDTDNKLTALQRMNQCVAMLSGVIEMEKKRKGLSQRPVQPSVQPPAERGLDISSLLAPLGIGAGGTSSNLRLPNSLNSLGFGGAPAGAASQPTFVGPAAPGIGAQAGAGGRRDIQSLLAAAGSFAASAGGRPGGRPGLPRGLPSFGGADRPSFLPGGLGQRPRLPSPGQRPGFASSGQRPGLPNFGLPGPQRPSLGFGSGRPGLGGPSFSGLGGAGGGFPGPRPGFGAGRPQTRGQALDQLSSFVNTNPRLLG